MRKSYSLYSKALAISTALVFSFLLLVSFFINPTHLFKSRMHHTFASYNWIYKANEGVGSKEGADHLHAPSGSLGCRSYWWWHDGKR